MMTDISPHQVASGSVEATPRSGSSTEHQPTLMELHQQASSDLKQSSMEHDDNWDDFRGYMQVSEGEGLYVGQERSDTSESQ